MAEAEGIEGRGQIIIYGVHPYPHPLYGQSCHQNKWRVLSLMQNVCLKQLIYNCWGGGG